MSRARVALTIGALVLVALAVPTTVAVRSPGLQAAFHARLASSDEVGVVDGASVGWAGVRLTFHGHARALVDAGDDALPVVLERARKEASDDRCALFRSILIELAWRVYPDRHIQHVLQDTMAPDEVLDTIASGLRSTSPSLRSATVGYFNQNLDPRCLEAMTALLDRNSGMPRSEEWRDAVRVVVGTVTGNELAFMRVPLSGSPPLSGLLGPSPASPSASVAALKSWIATNRHSLPHQAPP